MDYTLPGLILCEVRKLHPFQARCLRKISAIPHSFVSHVSNEEARQPVGLHALALFILDEHLPILPFSPNGCLAS